MIGIYKITRIETGKIYIGQSNDIERRFNEHKSCSSHFDCTGEILIKIFQSILKKIKNGLNKACNDYSRLVKYQYY